MANMRAIDDDTESPSDRNELADTVVGVSQVVLIALRSAAALAPIPYLQQAAILALTILDSVQGARGNQSGFAGLAADACNVVYIVTTFMDVKKKVGKDLPADLEHNLKSLLNGLQKIERFAQKKRGFLKRFVMSTTDAANIAEHRTMLNNSLATFGLESNLSIRDSVAQIAKRQEEMLDALKRNGYESGPRGSDRHGFLAHSNIHAANSTFTSIAGNVNNSSVNNTISNTNSGNVSTVNYAGYSPTHWH